MSLSRALARNLLMDYGSLAVNALICTAFFSPSRRLAT
jgi:hypothetical protein